MMSDLEITCSAAFSGVQGRFFGGSKIILGVWNRRGVFSGSWKRVNSLLEKWASEDIPQVGLKCSKKIDNLL